MLFCTAKFVFDVTIGNFNSQILSLRSLRSPSHSLFFSLLLSLSLPISSFIYNNLYKQLYSKSVSTATSNMFDANTHYILFGFRYVRLLPFSVSLISSTAEREISIRFRYVERNCMREFGCLCRPSRSIQIRRMYLHISTYLIQYLIDFTE